MNKANDGKLGLWGVIAIGIGRMGGGMWLWTPIGVLVVVLLVVLIIKVSKK
ncbi:MAG: hypothetical protein KKF30_19520 [Proteobacteria bacterium]|nr:hypothetical protein [Patescibacteria group bacterium]MBU4319455.1 hypothetical protein [Pseudomonadota bacterium]